MSKRLTPEEIAVLQAWGALDMTGAVPADAEGAEDRPFRPQFLPVDVPRMQPLTQLRYPGGLVERGPFDGVRGDEPDDDALRRRVGMRHPRAGLAGGGLPDVVRQPLRRRAPSDTENTNAWGRQEKVLYTDQPHEMARIQLECSSPLTVILDGFATIGTVKQDVGGKISLTAWFIVTYGAGSTNVTRKVRCDYHLEVSLLASFVQVQAYIGDLSGNAFDPKNFVVKGVPSGTGGNLAVQVARGVIGKPDRPTLLFTIENAASSVAMFGGPAVINTLDAHLTGAQAIDQFLQLFDTASGALPIDGTVPDYEWALGRSTSPGITKAGAIYLPDGIGFSQDMAFAVSTTSGTKTLSGAAVNLKVWNRQL